MVQNRPIKTVFLSSTAADLGEYRQAAFKAINGLGYHCVRMEDFPASPEPPEEYCRKCIGDCDVFVGLLGPCYGSSPKGKTDSFTQMEYETACKLNVPCYIFMTADNFPVPASLVSSCRYDEQQNFRERVRPDLVRSKFATPDELMFEIAKALRERKAEEPIPGLKCVVLCGGTATRLWPLTRSFCKVLLPVAGKPVLDYTLKLIKECHSIEKTFLLTSPAYEEDVQSFMAKSRAPGISVVVEPTAEAGTRLGPIGALRFFAESQDMESDLLVIGGDNIFGELRLDRFVQFAYDKGTSANAFCRFSTGSDASEYGVATLSMNETITKFEEKQEIPAYLNVSTALYLLRKNEVRMMPEYLDAGGDPLSLGSLINWFVQRGIPIAGHVFESPWFDVGSRIKLLDANRNCLKDTRRGACDNSTTIRGPVHIETKADIRNSYIGPNVYIGPGVTVEDSTIRDSIIMQGARVRHGQVAYSVVGPRSSVEGWVVESVVGQDAQIMSEVPQGWTGSAD